MTKGSGVNSSPGWKRTRQTSSMWTGDGEIDAALGVYRDAEAAYCETCDEIIEIEDGAWMSRARARLPELEAKATVRRAALDEAARLLDQVGGSSVAKMLRMGFVAKAISAIRQLFCATCGARAVISNEGRAQPCVRCRKRLLERALHRRDEEDDTMTDEAEDQAEKRDEFKKVEPEKHEETVATTVTTLVDLPPEPAFAPPINGPLEEADRVMVEKAEKAYETDEEKPVEEVASLSVSDASVPTASGKSEPERVFAVSDKEAAKRIQKLHMTHVIFEDACVALLQAQTQGDFTHAMSLWRDVAVADAKAAAAKAEVMELTTGLKVVASSGALNGQHAGKVVAKKPVVGKPLVSKAAPKAPPKAFATATNFAGWLKAARAGTGLSQVVFAERIGASETQMWHWEKGNRTPNSTYLSKIEKLAKQQCPYWKQLQDAGAL